jgi:transcriptional regulator with XRE-family HTH domain
MIKNKKTSALIEKNEPNPVDKHVGARIRLRRNILHLTQQKLADLLGLTFQQVQKYEKGLNRVGASRLWDISRVLEVSMDFFFEDMDNEVATQSPRMLKANEKYILAEKQHTFKDDPMNRKETLELIRAYYKIPNRKIAKELFELIVMLSKSNSNINSSEQED